MYYWTNSKLIPKKKNNNTFGFSVLRIDFITEIGNLCELYKPVSITHTNFLNITRNHSKSSRHMTDFQGSCGNPAL